MSDSSKYSRPVNFPREDGIEPPISKLKFPFSVNRLLKLPIVEGMDPEMELSLILKDAMTSKLPTDGDIVPSTPRPPRSIADTTLPEQETPVHEQMEGDGVLPVHVHPVTPPSEEVVVAAARSHITASSEPKAETTKTAKNIRNFNGALRPIFDVRIIDI